MYFYMPRDTTFSYLFNNVYVEYKSIVVSKVGMVKLVYIGAMISVIANPALVDLSIMTRLCSY